VGLRPRIVVRELSKELPPSAQRLVAVRIVGFCLVLVFVVAACTSGQDVGLNTTTTESIGVSQEIADLEAAKRRIEELESTVENLGNQNQELTLALEEKEAALRAANRQDNITQPVGVCPQPGMEPGGGQQVVLLYLTCDQMTTNDNRVLAGLVPVRRIVAQGENALAVAMDALLSGTTDPEETAGYGSFLSSATEDALIAADTEGTVAVIDLDAALIGSLNNVSTSTGGAYFRGQLYGTAFANAPVDSVEFRLDGDPVSFCALMELVSDCTPITRSEWNRDYTQTFEK